jgi:hypothetical protein
MKRLFLLFFVSLLFVMIGSVSCNDSGAELELGVGPPPAPVPQTGQTTCWDSDGTPINCADTGQDGDIQAGVVPPDPRFTDNEDGTITDNLTGLIWLKNANCLNGTVNWAGALTFANTLADPACGLSDGSVAGDWYLPNRNELTSLLDLENFNSALPPGNPFMNFQLSGYWSSTTLATNTFLAWGVDFNDGSVGTGDKANIFSLVTAVRGGL